MKTYITHIILLLVSLHLHSQTTFISGQLVFRYNKDNIKNPKKQGESGVHGQPIVIKTDKNDTISTILTSYPEGNFKLDSVSSGNYKAIYRNMFDQEIEVNINSNKHLKLYWDTLAIKNTNTFIDKISNGDTIFYDCYQWRIGGFKYYKKFNVYKHKNKSYISWYIPLTDIERKNEPWREDKKVVRVLSLKDIELIKIYELKVLGTELFLAYDNESTFTIKCKDKEVIKSSRSAWANNGFQTLCKDLKINWR